MTKVPGATRTYEVTKDDFPVRIEVVARNLPFCQAVASDVQIVEDGITVESAPVTVENDPAQAAIRYEISKPVRPPDLDLVQNIDCTFPDDAPAHSRYEVSIHSTAGDVANTTGSRPTINPRTVTLTFRYR
ncbi:MAG: hypothetical protein HYZ57_09320 [Acidobacteria bacterium]|nr:hypothetical protein [Acidobacteriota bacterium]